MKGTGRRALRAEIVHLVDDPVVALDRAHEHWSDGLLVLADGKVESCGDAPTLLATLPPNTEIIDYSGKLIVPGFIDAHVHYPQTDIVAAYGEKLLEWLTRYTFPTERRFDDPAYAREVADFFLAELLRNGTTTAAVFATVHPESVDAFFASAQALGARMIAGKVMMDRNCPPDLRDTAETSYEDSKALIERWHRCDRLLYAVTPRFAPTSTERQLELAGRLLDEHEGLYLQSHVAENADEVKWVAELYPWSRSYLDVYDHFGLVRERALYAHCLHLDATDRDRMGATGAAAVFCPTSNLFLGSGLFDVDAARRHRVPVAVGTDVGAGTSFSMLRTLDEAYKVAHLLHHRLSPFAALHLATLGGAQALRLDDRIGNFALGKEGDFVVLDFAATPLLARRMQSAATIDERLFALLMLGDDRCVAATYLMGEQRHARDNAFKSSADLAISGPHNQHRA
ncbi:MAG: guanine deaminase [Betaproteobacteria bacterium]|nr:MAG: guanine deaminase [Betaproteobacteria bacterium]